MSQIRPGSWVKVTTEVYDGKKGTRWVKVLRVVQGDATAYPIKVELAPHWEGQFRLVEIEGVRQP